MEYLLIPFAVIATIFALKYVYDALAGSLVDLDEDL